MLVTAVVGALAITMWTQVDLCAAQPSGDALGLSPVYATTEAPAPAGEADATELAKKLNNPISDLISVPFQYNADFNIGPKDATRQILNIQPVVPISISQDWNLIVRTIVPIIDIDSVATGVDSRSGLGDITQSFFFSPKAPVGDRTGAGSD